MYNKYVMLIFLFILSSCSTTNIESNFFRSPAQLTKKQLLDIDLKGLVELINKANNPFRSLALPPTASIVEIEQNTSALIERISGIDLFTLTKHGENSIKVENLVNLSIKNKNAIKKIISSYSLLMDVSLNQSFKIKIAGHEFRFGDVDQRYSDIKSNLDIKIVYDDPRGHFIVNRVEIDGKPGKHRYITAYTAPLNDPTNLKHQKELLELKSIIAKYKAKVKLHGGLPLRDPLSLQAIQAYNRIEEITKMSFDTELYDTMSKLSHELELQYNDIESRLPVQLLQKKLSEIPFNCSTTFSRFLNRFK